ncbi:MAG: hypothetical protein AAF146_10545 [Bacteroidota bacterium]
MVEQQMHLKQNFAVGIDFPKKRRELFGIPPPLTAEMNAQIYYNNYKGLGYRVGANVGFNGMPFEGNLGLSFDAQSGIGINPSITLKGMHGQIATAQTLGISYNSRRGLTDISLRTSLRYTEQHRFHYLSESEQAQTSVGGSSSLSFNFQGSVPEVRVPTQSTMVNFGLSFDQGYQWAWFSPELWGNWTGYAQWSRLVNGGKVTRRAYGYLNNQNAGENDFRDFNRTGLAYSKKVPNLSTSAYTYDPLVVSGVGIGGQFRPYRSKVELLHSPRQVSKADGFRVELELGIGNTIHAGVGFGLTLGESYSGPWRSGVPASLREPASSLSNDPLYQDYYYQKYGEKSGQVASVETQLAAWQAEVALRADLNRGSDEFSVNGQGQFVNQKTNASLDADDYTNHPALASRNNRTPKSDYLQNLTASQAYQYGFSRNLRYYRNGPTGLTTADKFPNPPNADNSQISEIIIHKSDGFRYAYGLPAKNQRQVDATFSVHPSDNNNAYDSQTNPNLDVVNLGQRTPNRASNQYESVKTLPGYAHSWLLTHIASTDYQDLTGDGMTKDDPGSWVKFNYLKTTGETAGEQYRWREPYVGSAFTDGKKSDYTDDLAAYLYGEKDLYYLRTVETATHVALFETSPRTDALGSNSEALGGNAGSSTPNSNRMYKLDRIKLFLKNLDGSLPDFATATPLTTVVMNYAGGQGTVSIPPLCDKTPSAENNGAKLTLAEVYLQSEASNRGRLSPYRFNYFSEQAISNPDYRRTNRDRWGYFQDNTQFGDRYPFLDFPYTNQYQAPNAQAWQLREITLPTGGKIAVQYEADDYAYEMDKPAVQMFDVIAVGDIPPNGIVFQNRFTNGAKYANISGAVNPTHPGRVYVDLSTPIPSAESARGGLTPKQYFYRHYLEGLDQVYFKTYIDLTDKRARSSDYVAGYAEFQPSSSTYDVLADNQGNLSMAYLTLKEVPLQDPSFGENVHPFSRAALDFLKLNRSELVHGYDPNQSDPGNFMDQIGNLLGTTFQFFREISIMVAGFNRYAYRQGWGQVIELNGRTVVRLKNGEGKMYGGGSRVKRLSLSDEWTHGLGAEEYGQQFDYTIEEEGRTISSGVAITPQGLGGDESALLYPVDYQLSNPLSASQNLFVEKPMMKGYYPGPSVGYRRVMVKSLADQQGVDIDEAYAPITVHEFYTHKDFPVFESETDLSSATPIHDIAIYYPIGSQVNKYIGRSQGYTVELNDMAGKPRAMSQRTFPTADQPAGSLIGRTEYRYRTEQDYRAEGRNRLSNQVSLLQADGNLVAGTIGESHDIFHDFHEDSETGQQYGADFNVDYWQLGIVPLFTFSVLGSFNLTETSVRTAVTHKIIYKTGLLDEVWVTDGRSSVSTKNVAYDPVTALPVLTRTTNEFDDYLYNYAEPAHWKYDDPTVGSMAGAYHNLDLQFANLTCTDGYIAFNNAPDYFVKGDELWLDLTVGTDRLAYVSEVEPNGIRCIQKDGFPFPSQSEITLTIARSGHRNLLQASVGSTTFLGPAGTTDANNFANREQHVLQTQATTYANAWKAETCNEYFVRGTSSSCVANQDLLALLDALADPSVGPSLDNGLTSNQDLFHPDYASLITGVVNPLQYGTLRYYPSSPVVGTDLQFGLTACPVKCPILCDLHLRLENGQSLDWSTVTGVVSIEGINPMDDSQVRIGFLSGGTVYYATRLPSTYDDCWSFCYQEISSGGGTPTAAARRMEDAGEPDRDLLTDGNGLPDGAAQAAARTICSYALEDCAANSQAPLNDWVWGNQGNWRTQSNHLYQTDRAYEAAFNDKPLLRELGQFETFVPFDWSLGADNAANNWVRATTRTKYSNRGEVLEEKDAIDNYAAVQYGYAKQVVVALGQNMRHREIAFDGFEDYDKDCTDHIRFTEASLATNVVTDEAHTGNYSIQVAPILVGPYLVKYLGESNTNCVGTFRPVPGERYLLSAWVKETFGGQQDPTDTEYENAAIQILFCSGGTASILPDFTASGPIIDGWQRIYADFTVPADAEFMELRLSNNILTTNDHWAYYDDIRIHPFDGNMVSYVYDRETLKLMATLDENNYATFTIRNQAGAAVKYNVETEKGIVTLREGMRHIKPN